MASRFQEFCRTGEQAIATVIADGSEELVALGRKHDARWHPNGFVVFELGPLGPGQLRLHIWPEGQRPMRQMSPHVHTHVWDLYSRVLVGTYEERMYDVLPDRAMGSLAFGTARIDYLRDRNTLEETSASHLVMKESVVARAGEWHAVEAGRPHETIIPTDTFVATLLLVSAPRLAEALVYSREPLPATNHTRESLSRDLKTALLDELQARFAKRATS